MSRIKTIITPLTVLFTFMLVVMALRVIYSIEVPTAKLVRYLDLVHNIQFNYPKGWVVEALPTHIASTQDVSACLDYVLAILPPWEDHVAFNASASRSAVYFVHPGVYEGIDTNNPFIRDPSTLKPHELVLVNLSPTAPDVVIKGVPLSRADLAVSFGASSDSVGFSGVKTFKNRFMEIFILLHRNQVREAEAKRAFMTILTSLGAIDGDDPTDTPCATTSRDGDDP